LGFIQQKDVLYQHGSTSERAARGAEENWETVDLNQVNWYWNVTSAVAGWLFLLLLLRAAADYYMEIAAQLHRSWTSKRIPV